MTSPEKRVAMSKVDKKRPQTPKPLDTYYRGQRYRSRLEARWAVAFDFMGIETRYEPQGFDLDGQPYLPDFYLPGRCMWAEIKPDLETSDLSKPIALARLSTEPVAVLGGIPEENSRGPHHLLIGWDRANNLTAQWFMWMPTSADVGGVLEEPHGYAKIIGRENAIPDMWRVRRSEVLSESLVAGAYRQARGARFEHGEKPADAWRGEIA